MKKLKVRFILKKELIDNEFPALNYKEQFARVAKGGMYKDFVGLMNKTICREKNVLLKFYDKKYITPVVWDVTDKKVIQLETGTVSECQNYITNIHTLERLKMAEEYLEGVKK